MSANTLSVTASRVAKANIIPSPVGEQNQCKWPQWAKEIDIAGHKIGNSQLTDTYGKMIDPFSKTENGD